MARRKYEELFNDTPQFTTGTRVRLERSVGRALFGRKSDPTVLRSAVCNATRELRAQGLDDEATLAVLAAMVETGGRSCRADRGSLLSGQPVWMAKRDRVIESSRNELAKA